MKIAKRCLQICLILAVLLSVFSFTSSAEGYQSFEDILEDYTEILPDTDVKPDGENAVSSLGIDALLYEILSSARNESGRIASFFLLLLGAAVLITLAGTLSGELATLLRSLVSGIAAMVVLSRIMPLISEVSSSLSEISGFFSLLIPVLAGAQAAGGGVMSAGTSAVGMSITLDLCALFTENVLGILVLSMFLSGVISSLGGGILTLCRGIKNVFTRGIGIVSTVLLGTLALQTLISGAQDNMALRAARYATSGFIPVVGSTVAGALSTLVGGITYAKSVVGGSAIAIIIGLAVSPIVLLLAYRLCFFIVLSFLDFAGATDGAAALAGVRDALDGLISVYVITCVVYVLEIAIILAAGVEV